MRAWALVLLIGCGGDDVVATTIDAQAELGDAFVPDGAPGGGGTALSHTLFVQTEGVSVSAGTDDATANTSSLATAGTAALGKFLATDAQRTTKIAAIKQQLDGILSPYQIVVTTTRPASGSYDMVVLTDDSPAKLGQNTGTVFAVPSSCNTIASEIGFEFGTGLSRDNVVRDTVAMFAVTAGIPASAKAGDCLFVDQPSANLTAPCTIGHAGTPIATSPRCPTNGATMDENALFLTAFGAH